MSLRPPSWARRLVGMALLLADRDDVLTELDELFAARATRFGRGAALWWYLRQPWSFLVHGARSRAADGVHDSMALSRHSLRRAVATALAQDFHFAVRGLRRAPAFAVTALGILGLGLAGAITVFSLVYGILLRPLPYDRADRLVAIFTSDKAQAGRGPSAPANMLDLQRDSRTLTALTAAHPWSPTLQSDEPRRLAGLKATWNMFDLVRADAELGRTWQGTDSAAGVTSVVVLGHGLWRREFGGDTGVVGTTVSLDGDPYEVIGVMPDGFAFPPFWADDAELWVRLDLGATPSRTAQFVRVFGRMRDDASMESVRAEVATLYTRLAEAFPRANGAYTMFAEPLREPVVSTARPVLIALAIATSLLLLVAVANVANLMLGRSLVLERERALRRALGAPRWRLVVPDFLQAGLLGVAGGGVGLVVAALVVRAVTGQAALDLPRAAEVTIDQAVVIVGLGGAVACGLVFGVFSALRQPEAAALIRAGVGQSRRGSGPVRDGLVVAEVALAVVLLVGAGLSVRSLARQLAIDPGLRPEGMLTATVDLGGTTLAEPDRQLALFREVVTRLEAIPGVASAALVNHLPMAGDVWGATVSRGDIPYPEDQERHSGIARVVSPEYFEAAGIPVLTGRGFVGWHDGGVPVVLINRPLAEEIWPGQDPVGRRLRIGGPDDPIAEVIGVVGNVAQGSLAEPSQPEFYRPYGQNPYPWFEEASIVVRTKGDPSAVAPAARAAIRALAPGAPITGLRTMADIVGEELFPARAVTVIVTVFAGFAALVSGLGLFGVIAYLVNQRRREFGIRLALGARPGAVARVVLGRTLALVTVGAIIGVAAAAALAGLAEGLLYGVPTRDPIAFVGAVLGLAAVDLLAAWWPARRAAAIDPAALLREE